MAASDFDRLRNHWRGPIPEIDICSRCHDHCSWWWDDTEWLSECCSAQPVEVDPT